MPKHKVHKLLAATGTRKSGVFLHDHLCYIRTTNRFIVLLIRGPYARISMRS